MQGGRGGCGPGHLGCEVRTRSPLGLLLRSLRGSAWGPLGPLEGLLQPPVSCCSRQNPKCPQATTGLHVVTPSVILGWVSASSELSSARLWCVMEAADTLSVPHWGEGLLRNDSCPLFCPPHLCLCGWPGRHLMESP